MFLLRYKIFFSMLSWNIPKLVSIETYVVRDKSLSIQSVNWEKYWKNILWT